MKTSGVKERQRNIVWIWRIEEETGELGGKFHQDGWVGREIIWSIKVEGTGGKHSEDRRHGGEDSARMGGSEKRWLSWALGGEMFSRRVVGSGPGSSEAARQPLSSASERNFLSSHVRSLKSRKLCTE